MLKYYSKVVKYFIEAQNLKEWLQVYNTNSL